MRGGGNLLKQKTKKNNKNQQNIKTNTTKTHKKTEAGQQQKTLYKNTKSQ